MTATYRHLIHNGAILGYAFVLGLLLFGALVVRHECVGPAGQAIQSRK